LQNCGRNLFCVTTEYLHLTQFLHLPESQMSQRAMVAVIFIFVLTSCRVHGSLRITPPKYPVVEYTKLVSEEHFGVGRSLVIVLLLGEHDSSNNEVSYLIKALHTSGNGL
jgi:hypothetical protein